MLLTAPAIALLIACGGALASQSYKPPASGQAWTISKVYMKSASQEGKAQAVVAFLCNEPEGQHRIQIFAENLEPRAVCSLWLVAAGETGQPAKVRRLTRRIWPQRADRHGEFRLVVATLDCLVSRYDYVMLRQHPPGSRVDFESGTPVLSGHIDREAHEPPDDG